MFAIALLVAMPCDGTGPQVARSFDMIYHVTAHAIGRLNPLLTFEAATFAWHRLQAAFPEALAAVLMPEHFHLMAEADVADSLRRRVAAVLSGLTRSGRFGRTHHLWEPVPAPRAVPDVHHLRRQIRYLALNPCRAGLCSDPLSWIWSTHRDVMGAVADPWVTADRLAAALRAPRRGFAAAHHAYVSGDPTVRVTGTPPPLPAPRRESPAVTLEAVAAAACAALRRPLEAVMTSADARRLFVQVARHQGWGQTSLVARRCGLKPWRVRHLARSPAPGLAAALLCLGDDRLLGAAPPAQAPDLHALAEPMPLRITEMR